MSMIDSDHLKTGLLPVQQAYANFKQATAARKEATTGGADFDSLIEAENAAMPPMSMPAWCCTAPFGAR